MDLSVSSEDNNACRDAVRYYERHQSMRKQLRNVWMPCTLSFFLCRLSFLQQTKKYRYSLGSALFKNSNKKTRRDCLWITQNIDDFVQEVPSNFNADDVLICLGKFEISGTSYGSDKGICICNRSQRE